MCSHSARWQGQYTFTEKLQVVPSSIPTGRLHCKSNADLLPPRPRPRLRLLIHTHTHTHIYIYIHVHSFKTRPWSPRTLHSPRYNQALLRFLPTRSGKIPDRAHPSKPLLHPSSPQQDSSPPPPHTSPREQTSGRQKEKGYHTALAQQTHILRPNRRGAHRCALLHSLLLLLLLLLLPSHLQAESNGLIEGINYHTHKADVYTRFEFLPL